MKPFCVRRLACLDSFVGLEGCIGLGVLERHLGSTSNLPLAFSVLAGGQSTEILGGEIHCLLRALKSRYGT